MIEIVDGTVNYVRSSRSKPNTDTVFVCVDGEYGEDDRIFSLHVIPGSYKSGDSVKLLINGPQATVA